MVPSLGLPDLPIMGGSACPGGSLDPVCQIAGAGASSLVGAGAGAVLSALASWVVAGADWLLGQIGAVLSASGGIDLGASWFGRHYDLMVALAATVLLPLVLLGVMQAVYRQSPAMLVRAGLVHLPLALLLSVAAVQLVGLGLSSVDAMCRALSPASGGDVTHTLAALSAQLLAESADPTLPAFVLLLGGALVVLGAFALWVELLVRSAAVYLAVLFLPLGLASLAWPAVSHWCRRLVETLAALVLSKLVIVAALALAAGEVASGSSGGGFAQVLGGGAMLLLASFTPFALLRLVPMVEAGAVHHLEGVRQRASRSLGTPTRRVASSALAAVRASGTDVGSFGSGIEFPTEAPGPADGPAGSGGSPGLPAPAGGEGASTTEVTGRGTVTVRRRRAGAVPLAGQAGLPSWRGSPESDRAFVAVLRGGSAGTADDGPQPLLSALPARAAPPGGSASRWDRRRHEIGHDDLGPVVRWLPPAPPAPVGPRAEPPNAVPPSHRPAVPSPEPPPAVAPPVGDVGAGPKGTGGARR